MAVCNTKTNYVLKLSEVLGSTQLLRVTLEHKHVGKSDTRAADLDGREGGGGCGRVQVQ
jgi:hypothetical protein